MQYIIGLDISPVIAECLFYIINNILKIAPKHFCNRQTYMLLCIYLHKHTLSLLQYLFLCQLLFTLGGKSERKVMDS